MKIPFTRGYSIVGGVSIPLLPIKSQRLYLVKKSDYNWQMEVIPMQERNPPSSLYWFTNIFRMDQKADVFCGLGRQHQQFPIHSMDIKSHLVTVSHIRHTLYIKEEDKIKFDATTSDLQ